MDKKRFYYDRSVVYGWCVYDRQTNTPAYDTCAEYLLPVKQDEDGTTTESPVLLANEYVAMRLCARLNVAYKRSMKNMEVC